MPNEQDQPPEHALLLALVTLLAEQRGERFTKVRPTEILLAEAGLTNRQIASVLSKKEPAVAKAISRAGGRK